MDLNIATLNINGLRGKQSQEELFNLLQSEKLDVLLLQETHVDNTQLSKYLQTNLNMTGYWSFGTNKIAGTSICISNAIDFKTEKFDIDINGRIVCLDIILCNTPFRILNTYAPTNYKERIEFFNEISKYLVCNRYVIWGGDFNCVLNTKIDKFGKDMSTLHGNLASKELNSLIFDYQLEDIFRKINPSKIITTWHYAGKDIHCRLDRFYISKSLVDINISFNLIPFANSDHDLFLMKIPNIKKGKFGPNFWKFNNELLKDQSFIDLCKQFLNYHIKDFDNNTNSWDKLKEKIKTLCISFSKNKAKTEFQKLHKLRQDYNNLVFLEKQNPGEFKEQFDALKLEIKQLENKRFEGAKIRAKCKVFDDNENVSNYFHKKEKQNAQKRTINEIIKNDKSYTEQSDLMSCFEIFYQELYTSEPVEPEVVNTFLQDLPTLNSEEAISIEGKITKDECLYALKGMDFNKSPGPDGLSKEFYLTFFDILGDVLEKIIQHIFENNSLSQSQKLSYISLLCKDPTNSTDMKNWRPISLLNVDYKIISKVLTNRLNTVIENVVHPDQTCSVKSRSILDNVHLLRNIIDYVNQKELTCIFLNLDQEKAFDRVSYEYLFTVLENLGFKESFVRWIKILYHDISSSVIVNNFISKPFNILRGVRQGCSLSPLLYVLVLEPFANKIRNDISIKGLQLPGSSVNAKIALYADDATAILTDLQSVKRVLDTCYHFGRASGAKLNILKTKGIFLGKWKRREDHPFGISWVDNCKILGVKLGNFLTHDDIWHNILVRFEKCLNICKTRNIPIKGKSLIINVLACSKLWYTGSVLIPPPFHVKQFNKMIYHFLWKNKVEMLSRKSMELSFLEGGQNIINIENKLKAFLLKHIQQIIDDREVKWKYFAIYWLGFSLREFRPDFKSLKIPHSDHIPTFYKKCLEIFKDFQKTCPQLKLGNLSVKIAYSALSKVPAHKHIIVNKVPIVNFTSVWKVLNNSFIDPFARDISWKIIHDIIPLNSLLFKRKISNVLNCVLCETVPETVMHLFIECPVVKPLFNIIDYWFKRIAHQPNSTLNHDFVVYHLTNIKLKDPEQFDILLAILTEFKQVVWTMRLLKRYNHKVITSNSLILYFISKLKLRIQCDFQRLSFNSFIDHWCLSGLFCSLELNEIGTNVNFFI